MANVLRSVSFGRRLREILWFSGVVAAFSTGVPSPSCWDHHPPLLLPQPSLPVGMSVIGGRKVQGETLGFVLYCWREASSAAGRGRRRKGPLESNSPWACVPQFSWEVGPVHSHPCQPLVVTALAPVTLPLCQLLRDLPAKGLPGLWHLS